MNRIKDKINELQNYLEELLEIIPENLKDYKREFKTRAACERYFERIINAIIDLSFIFIKEFNLPIPEEEKQVFDILANQEIISEQLKARLKDAKGMRNILAHEYGIIEDEIVFDSIKEELVKDTEDFLNSIEDYLDNQQINN